jgi:UDP-N-acetylmuramyl pentapeptide phosphotransferase/UDP-N-acetylglucosamine-1-phosphate transferase
MIVKGRVAGFLGAVGATLCVRQGMRRWPPGEAALWERKNFEGEVVDLYAGPATALGTAAAVAASPLVPGRARTAAVLAVLAAGGCGAYDDMVGRNDPRRGFRAHLTALGHGEITSGAVKLLGIGAAGLAAGALLRERPLDKVLAGVVVAGTAHLVNLVDVRPGRAAGTVLALGAGGVLKGGTAGVLAAAPVGAAAAVLEGDLGRRTMLGDTGAHALGAGLGVAMAAGGGRTGLVLHAAVLVAAAVCGERVSRVAGAS